MISTEYQAGAGKNRQGIAGWDIDSAVDTDNTGSKIVVLVDIRRRRNSDVQQKKGDEKCRYPIHIEPLLYKVIRFSYTI